MRLAPGGPFDSQRRLPPEIEHNVEAAYNLDKPVWQQYLLYLDHLAHGDLGPDEAGNVAARMDSSGSLAGANTDRYMALRS